MYIYIYYILYIISTHINSPGNVWERSWQTMVFASLMSSTRCLLAGQMWGVNRDHDWHASYTDEPGLLQIQTNPSTSTTSFDHPPVPMTNMLYCRVTFREMKVTCAMCVVPTSFHQGWPILDGQGSSCEAIVAIIESTWLSYIKLPFKMKTFWRCSCAISIPIYPKYILHFC